MTTATRRADLRASPGTAPAPGFAVYDPGPTTATCSTPRPPPCSRRATVPRRSRRWPSGSQPVPVFPSTRASSTSRSPIPPFVGPPRAQALGIAGGCGRPERAHRPQPPCAHRPTGRRCGRSGPVAGRRHDRRRFSRLAADTPNAPQGPIPTVVAQNKSASTLVDTPVPVTLTATEGHRVARLDHVHGPDGSHPRHGRRRARGGHLHPGGRIRRHRHLHLHRLAVRRIRRCGARLPRRHRPFPDTGSDPATVTITVTEPSTTTTTGAAPTTEAKPAVQSTATPRFTG